MPGALSPAPRGTSVVVAAPRPAAARQELGAVSDLARPLEIAGKTLVDNYEAEIATLVRAREEEIKRVRDFVSTATAELKRAKEDEEGRLNAHMGQLKSNFEQAMAVLEAQVRELVQQSTAAMEAELTLQRDQSRAALEDKAHELVSRLTGSAPPQPQPRTTPRAVAASPVPSTSVRRAAAAPPPSAGPPPTTPRRQPLLGGPPTSSKTHRAAPPVTPIYRNTPAAASQAPTYSPPSPAASPPDPVARARALRASADERLSAIKPASQKRSTAAAASSDASEGRARMMSGMRAETAAHDLANSLDISPKRQASRRRLAARAGEAQRWLARPVKVRDVVGEHGDKW